MPGEEGEFLFRKAQLPERQSQPDFRKHLKKPRREQKGKVSVETIQ